MKVRGFAKILVAVDGSPQSENAVTVVASLARPGTQVRVVHVWNLKPTDGRGWWDVETRSEAEKLVEKYVARLESAGIALVHHIQAPVLVTERHPVP